MPQRPHVLIIDDDKALCDILSDVISGEGLAVTTTGNGNDALQLMQENRFAVLLLDLLLPGMDGLEVLEKVVRFYPEVVVVMMSGHGTIKKAIEATRLGAYDWIEKPLKQERLVIALRNALEKNRILQGKDVLLEKAKQRYAMIGVSTPMKEIFQLIDKVAPSRTSIIISGESGTGKELVARAIHINSDRSGGPFIKVNCAAVPETLVESELFGHVKGSFTGAMRDKRGKFQMADGGTLLLDEVGDLSPAAQAKIMRALESGEVTRVGTEKVEEVDIRLLTATNKDLREMVDAGIFREDLYHRINVLEIFLPPLRERQEDIMPILQYYLEYFAEENKREPKRLTPDAEAMILSHNWPCNVRELKNFAEKLDILVNEQMVSNRQVTQILFNEKAPVMENPHKTFKTAKLAFEQHFLLRALEEHEWNVTRTAADLEMPRSLLYKKMKRYGLK